MYQTLSPFPKIHANIEMRHWDENRHGIFYIVKEKDVLAVAPMVGDIATLFLSHLNVHW